MTNAELKNSKIRFEVRVYFAKGRDRANSFFKVMQWAGGSDDVRTQCAKCWTEAEQDAEFVAARKKSNSNPFTS